MQRFTKYIVLLLLSIIAVSPAKVPHMERPSERIYSDSLLLGFGGWNYTHTFSALRELEHNMMFAIKKDLKSISILHIGDSHIQAGWFTGRLRERFQVDFGDGGRGLIMPLKLASTNEPNDYRITSSGRWQSSKINSRKTKERAGVGGISIFDSRGDISIKLLDDGTSRVSAFDEVIIYHSPTSAQMESSCLYDLKIGCQDTTLGVTTNIVLSNPVDSINIRSQGEVEYYGFDLRRSNPGVVYHSIGVNSACYIHYGARSDILSQMSLISPNLIIVSMGTNEASGSRFISSQFYVQVDQMVSKLKAQNPYAAILLTTPAPLYRRGVENGNVALVAQTLKEYAKKNNLALYDNYRACRESGLYGYGSSFYSRDGIHLTKEGYKHMADMLYDRLMDSYYSVMKDQNR